MSSKSKYLAMFQSPLFYQPTVVNLLTEARAELKREDLVTWVMRFYKYTHLKPIIDKARPEEYPSERRWLSELEARNPDWKTSTRASITQVVEYLKHARDLGIPSINNIRFGIESWDEVVQKILLAEEEWRETLEDIGLEEYGEKIIEFPDGSAWFDLQRSGCRMEAQAMGHCGNGSGYSNQTLLSYRKPIKDGVNTLWSPRLTFVLDKRNGHVGEMKGRANEKPAARYHPYIVALLETDRITKLVGGGYKPENNFALEDLAVADRDRLLAIKPGLFTVTQLARIFPKLDDCPVDIRAALKLDMGVDPVMQEEKSFYPISTFMDLEDTAKVFAMKNLDNYRSVLDDGYFDLDLPGLSAHCYAEDVITELRDQHPEVFSQFIEMLSPIAEENGLDDDLESVKGILKALAEEGGELELAVRKSLASGDEAGAMDELFGAFNDMLKSPFRGRSGSELFFERHTEKDTFRLLASEQYILDRLRDTDFDDYLSEEDLNGALFEWVKGTECAEDLSVPYYGYSGFCEEAALSALVENIRELAPAKSTNPTPLALVSAAPFGTETNTAAMLRMRDKDQDAPLAANF